MAKKVFIDAEFTGLHKLSTLISIALVCEDGNEFYAEFDDYDELQINEWLRENVIAKLILGGYDFNRDYKPNEKLVKVKGDTELIKQALTDWLGKYKDEGVELWGDVPSDDTIHFRSVFGNAWDVPQHVNYMVFDLATALKLCRQNPDVDRAEFVYGSKDKIPTAELSVHNSLYDARLEKEVYAKIFSLLDSAGNSSLKEDEEEVEVEEVEAEEVQIEGEYNPSAAQDLIDSELRAEEESNTMQIESLNESETPEPKEDVHKGFVEPSQEEVNYGGQEFESPIG